MQRMKNSGMDISRAEATKLAQQSNAALLQRLHQGGESMPPFSQLKETEINALLAYLRELADLPGAKNVHATVTETHVRVGELIVKSTCHTCHSALGRNPGPDELMNGAIPPLSTLTKRKTEPEFVQKVTQGAPVVMGTPPLPCRGRMPVFFYLSEEEAADVYLYLTLYPPTDKTNTAPIVASMGSVQPPSDGGPGPSNPSRVTNEKAAAKGGSTEVADVRMEGLPWWSGAIAVLLLTGGLVFTLREFRRLSSESEERKAVALKPTTGQILGWSLDRMPQEPFPARTTIPTELRMDDSQQK
jgi:mono/diheme cytochrome c family protein